ncbi:MAG: DUF3791 domain-containing protein [Desulfovibrio sp.]|nr:DUF3791 domain-containing protein [Desulfovibrio sp.]
MNTDELNFAVFCVESAAEKLELSGAGVYRLLTQDSRILDSICCPLTTFFTCRARIHSQRHY